MNMRRAALQCKKKQNFLKILFFFLKKKRIQDIESGVSYIVIHLAKLVNKFASCKDAQEKGFRGNKITIDVGGSARKVSCE